MANTALTWAIESTYGEFVAGDYVIPVDEISTSQEIESIVDSGLRGVSAAKDYSSIPTTGRANAEVGGFASQEVLGDLLFGIMGKREVYEGGWEYSVDHSPPSFSIQCEDIGSFDPRFVHRYTGCYLRELSITIEIKGLVHWKASFYGAGKTLVVGFLTKKWAEEGSWNPEENTTWDTMGDLWGPGYGLPGGEVVEWAVRPSEKAFVGWNTNVFFGSENKRESVHSITMTLSRKEDFHYSSVFTNPSRMFMGPVEVTFDVSVTHDERSDEERYEDKTQEKVEVESESDGKTFLFRSSKTDFGDAPIEKDRSEPGMLLTYHCRGLYNEDDSGPCIFRLF